jgi:ankyrin repeat protein
MLLEAGIDRDGNRESDGTTALHIACEADRAGPEAISCLLKHGATPNFKDTQGWTPLHYATENLANTAALIGSNGERKEIVDERNDYGSTALVIAAETGSVEVVEFLLKHGTDPTIRNKTGSSALHRAAQNGHLGVVRLLIDNKYKQVDQSIAKNNGATALHMAANYGKLDVIKYLLSTDGVDINAHSDGNGTLLSFAIIGEKKEAVKFLLERGADPNIRRNGELAMQLAIETIDSEMVEIVLNTSKYALEGLQEALWAAVRKGMLDAVKALLDHGTNLSRNTHVVAPGCNLLTYAIRWDSAR